MTITVNVPNDWREEDVYAVSPFLELPFECPQRKTQRAH